MILTPHRLTYHSIVPFRVFLRFFYSDVANCQIGAVGVFEAGIWLIFVM